MTTTASGAAGGPLSSDLCAELTANVTAALASVAASASASRGREDAGRDAWEKTAEQHHILTEKIVNRVSSTEIACCSRFFFGVEIYSFEFKTLVLKHFFISSWANIAKFSPQ